VAARVFKLEELTWTEVDTLDRSRTAVFLLSSSIEQHGPHLPLGTELVEASAVMRAVAWRVVRAGWTVLLAPPRPYTTAVLSRTFPGSTSVRARHLEGLFTDVVASFAVNGFADIVVFSQHLDRRTCSPGSERARMRRPPARARLRAMSASSSTISAPMRSTGFSAPLAR
jgi:creatinine amidohydrolase